MARRADAGGGADEVDQRAADEEHEPDRLARLIDEVEVPGREVALLELHPDDAGNEDVANHERGDRDGECRPRRCPRGEVRAPQHEPAKREEQGNQHQGAAQLHDNAHEREDGKGLRVRLHCGVGAGQRRSNSLT